MVQTTLTFQRRGRHSGFSTSSAGSSTEPESDLEVEYIQGTESTTQAEVIINQATSSSHLTATSEAELVSLEDFRAYIYENNHGFEDISVQREDFLEKLLGVYKCPSFNYRPKTKVQFIGKPGLRNFSKALYF